MDATGVSLSISLSPGIQATSATWSIGTCTVSAQQVDCQTANFANQSSSTFSISVTGQTAGDRNLSMTLSSNEADADSTNNSFNVTVSVNDPDDGGGAIGLPFLFLLAFAAGTRRRHTLR
jgi:MYXO-CTERM domain-containing protein